MTITPITQRELALQLGISPAAVVKGKQAGMPVDSVEAARAWRATHLRSYQRHAAPSSDQAAAPSDYHAARAERETAEARIAQIRLAELEGAVIRVDAVRHGLAGLLATTRDRLMQLPTRLAVTLAAESSQERVHAILADEIHHALTQLAAAPEHVGLEAQE